jgi:hypothetical protein
MTTGHAAPIRQRVFCRDSDYERARDRAARGALRVTGLDPGTVLWRISAATGDSGLARSGPQATGRALSQQLGPAGRSPCRQGAERGTPAGGRTWPPVVYGHPDWIETYMSTVIKVLACQPAAVLADDTLWCQPQAAEGCSMRPMAPCRWGS